MPSAYAFFRSASAGGSGANQVPIAGQLPASGKCPVMDNAADKCPKDTKCPNVTRVITSLHLHNLF